MNNEELGLVDKLIFEAYKDKALISMEKFRYKIKSNFGTIPSSDLYRKIINYQIKKYGKQLDVSISREYQDYFYKYSRKNREEKGRRNREKFREDRNLERIYEKQARKDI